MRLLIVIALAGGLAVLGTTSLISQALAGATPLGLAGLAGVGGVGAAGAGAVAMGTGECPVLMCQVRCFFRSILLRLQN